MVKTNKNNGVEEINEKQFVERTKNGISVFDFWASWCMPCVMMAPILDELAEKFKGKISFAKLNIDENPNLSEKFNVMSIPTLIIFKNGKEIERIVGSQPFERIEEKLNGLI